MNAWFFPDYLPQNFEKTLGDAIFMSFGVSPSRLDLNKANFYLLDSSGAGYSRYIIVILLAIKSFSLLRPKGNYEIMSGKEIFTNRHRQVSHFISRLRKERILHDFEHEYLWVYDKKPCHVEVCQFSDLGDLDFFRVSLTPYLFDTEPEFLLGVKNFDMTGITNWGGRRKRSEKIFETLRREFQEEFGSFPEELEIKLFSATAVLIRSARDLYIEIFVPLSQEEMILMMETFRKNRVDCRNGQFEIKEIISVSVNKIFSMTAGELDGSFAFEMRELRLFIYERFVNGAPTAVFSQKALV